MRRRPLLFLTLLGLALRIGFLILEPHVVPSGDEPSWIVTGIRAVLKLKHPFSPFESSLLFYPPGYPYLIAVAKGLTGSTRAVLWVQTLLGALLVPIIGRIGATFSPRAGLIAAAITAIYPELLWYSAHFWSETLFLFLLWCGFERAMAADVGAPIGAAVAAGVLIGLASLTRETALCVVPLLALWLFWNRGGQGALRALALVLAAMVTIAPWTARNWIVYRGFVPVATAGALNLWEGNTREPRSEVYARADAVSDPVDQYRYALSMARAAIVQRQPQWLFEKLGSEMPLFWGAESEAAMHLDRGAYGPVPLWAPGACRRLLALPYLIVLALALVSLAAIPPNRTAWLLLAFIAGYNLLHVVSHAMDRYRLPVLPALCVFAGSGWSLWRAGTLRSALAARRAVAVTAALSWVLVAFWSLR